MSHNQKERRSGPRVSANVPVRVRSRDGEQAGRTRDLSTNGMFLYTQGDFATGSAIELVLILPPELANGKKRWACCQASVVRVEEGAERGRVGLAASIERLQLLPEIPE